MPQGSIAAAVRHFWQLWPKAFTVRSEPLSLSEDRLAIELMPPLAADEYAEQAADPVQQVKLYYCVLNGQYKLKQGMTKTDELLVCFGDAADAPPAEVFQVPLRATAPPEWHVRSGVWGPMPIGDTPTAQWYTQEVNEALAGYVQAREEGHEYGMLNFGDWWGERKYNWGNIEYDTQHGFLQEYARSGHEAWFDLGEQAARHNVDVDTVHYAADPYQVGAVYVHCLCHVGGYYEAGFVDGGIAGGGFSVCHTWTEGNLEYALLTGDRRALETALQVADHFDGTYLNNYDFTNMRLPGWHLILTAGAYRATADPYYLNAGRIIVERVLERERLGGGFRRHMVPGHCYDEPRHHGNAGFMLGVLMEGLKRMYELTGDERIPPVVVRTAQYYVREMWEPEKEGFRYTSCPNTEPGRGMNMSCAEGFGWAAALSQDPELVAIFRRGMEIAIPDLGGFGKSISHAIRGAPHALWHLQELPAALRPLGDAQERQAQGRPSPRPSPGGRG